MTNSNELFELLQDAEDRDQLSSARVIYEAILEDEPDQPEIQVLYAANLVELGDLSAAEEILLQLPDLEEPEIQAGLLTQKAHLARACGDFPKAEAYYRAAHKLTNDGGENLLNAAIMAARQKELAKADYLFREATKLKSEFQSDAWYNLAGNLIAQQRYEEAKKCYREVLELEPDHSLAQEWLEDLDQREIFLSNK